MPAWGSAPLAVVPVADQDRQAGRGGRVVDALAAQRVQVGRPNAGKRAPAGETEGNSGWFRHDGGAKERSFAFCAGRGSRSRAARPDDGGGTGVTVAVGVAWRRASPWPGARRHGGQGREGGGRVGPQGLGVGLSRPRRRPGGRPRGVRRGSNTDNRIPARSPGERDGRAQMVARHGGILWLGRGGTGVRGEYRTGAGGGQRGSACSLRGYRWAVWEHAGRRVAGPSARSDVT